MPRRIEVDEVEAWETDWRGPPPGSVRSLTIKQAIELEEWACPGGLRDAWAQQFDERSDARLTAWASSPFSAGLDALLNLATAARVAEEARAARRRQEAQAEATQQQADATAAWGWMYGVPTD